MEEKTDKLTEERLHKLKALKEKGVNPYGGRYPGAKQIGEVIPLFKEGEEVAVKCAGRIIAIRQHGKTQFVDIKDWAGKIQVYFNRKQIGDESFEILKLLDIGDIIGVEGRLLKTRTGELTIFADGFVLLAKSLHPLPEKWHGLKDVETRYRQRYLDLIANNEVMESFLKRVKIINAIRGLLNAKGFVEVETPVMQSSYGGAAAKPFITHHNALDMKLYLRISPELYLKRLLVGGMDRVYEISRNFRNEGVSTRHSPEFTMIEIYQSYADYTDMMDLTEEIITAAAHALELPEVIPFGELEISLKRPFARKKYLELFEEHNGFDFFDFEKVRKRAKEMNLPLENRSDIVLANDLFEETVEQHLIDPTFVYDYPAQLCPLTRRKEGDEKVAERFEPFIARIEMGNAYTELNDPAVQKANFENQLKEADHDWGILDEDFIRALEHGMPPAGGLGIGIDRLVMLLTNNHSIRDVILFPLLRRV